MQLIPHADLTPYNTFGVPARARWLGRFHDAATLRDLLARPELRTAPHMVLGGGSNVLFAGDHPGAVLLNEVPGIHLVHEDDHHVLVRAGAGVYWHDLVMHAVAQGWGGIENMSLIPGKVGAAPMQNIGAYGVEVKDVLHALEALRIADGEVVGFTRADCAFGYRESFFKRAGHDRFVIMGVTLRLHKAPHTVSTQYGSINDELARRGITTPTIRDISDAVIAIRRSKLPEPKELGNAGSFFKNPVVPAAVADAVRKAHPQAPHYPAPDGQVKLAAGWLIEQAGWKGYRANGCGVHEHQALVLVNHGGATGREVLDLSERIMASVHERFGVRLEREVNVVG